MTPLLSVLYTLSLASLSVVTFAQGLADASLERHIDTLALTAGPLNPIIPAYWTGLPKHRRTPLAISPDGKTAFLAYLDASGSGVHVQALDPSTFAAKGAPVTVADAHEAGGLVAQDDGFALLTNLPVTDQGANNPPNNTPVPAIVRFKNGQQAWRAWLGGPTVPMINNQGGMLMSPDINGDLVYSNASGLYGAYFVVTAYQGPAQGHYGDSHEYVDDSGKLQTIKGASATWGCSHNTGIAFEAADKPPFASICAGDSDGIWLNTLTNWFEGTKISTEHTRNGASGENMGGMSGSYSVLANFPGTSKYIFAWQTRGAINLYPNTWLGGKHVSGDPRTLNHNVAIALLSNKSTLIGQPALQQAGAKDGDTQLNLLTTGTTIDRSNIRVEAWDATNALVSWEELSNPTCNNPEWSAMGCNGTYAGTFWQQVNADGKKVGTAIKRNDTFVSGDMTRFPGGRICWPYVNGLKWDLSKPVPWNNRGGQNATKMSFACMKLDGATGSGSSTSVPPTTSSTSTSTLTTSSTPSVSPSTSTTTRTSTTSPITSFKPSTASSTTSTTSSRTRRPTRRPRRNHLQRDPRAA